jgi:hypothetical protein
MSSISEFFGWARPCESEEIPEIFPVSINQVDFVKADVVTIYTKILTDVLERTHGLTDDQVALMWDNCVKSSLADGLVTMLAKAMSDKQDLFLVYDKAVKVLRVATSDERQKIEEDYKKTSLELDRHFHQLQKLRAFRHGEALHRPGILHDRSTSQVHESLEGDAAEDVRSSLERLFDRFFRREGAGAENRRGSRRGSRRPDGRQRFDREFRP